MNYLGLVIARDFVVIIVVDVQIITKAGYSPWWILLPLAMPVMYFVDVCPCSTTRSPAFRYVRRDHVDERFRLPRHD